MSMAPDDRDRDQRDHDHHGSGCRDGGGPATGPDGRDCSRDGERTGPEPTQKPDPNNSPFPY